MVHQLATTLRLASLLIEFIIYFFDVCENETNDRANFGWLVCAGRYTNICFPPFFCLSHASVAQSDFVQTLKMQVYFMDHALDANQIIGRHREQLLAKSQPLTRDIINSVVHSKHDDNKYFKKLATDIIVHFSLGNPTKAEVMLINFPFFTRKQ